MDKNIFICQILSFNLILKECVFVKHRSHTEDWRETSLARVDSCQRTSVSDKKPLSHLDLKHS
jgi:hypothetical protein